MSTGCTKCDGTGKVLAYKMIDQFCGNCDGTGEVIPDPALSRRRRTPNVGHGASVCPMCRGRGRAPTRTLVQVNCDTCKGQGQIWYRANFPDGVGHRHNAGVAVASDSEAFWAVPHVDMQQPTGRDCLGGVEGPTLQCKLNQTFK
jgi:RecJ-like exonuclease